MPNQLNQALCADLTALLNRTKKDINNALEEYNHGAADIEAKSKLNQLMIERLEEVLSKEQWHDTLLLKNIIAPFEELYKDLVKERNQFDKEIAPPDVIRANKKDNELEVFILLYQTDGYDYEKWNRQISSLLSMRVTRPIYDSEEAMGKVIRARLSQVNDAYMIAVIKKDKILDLNQGLIQNDRHGQKIIYLHEEALTASSFIEFVHLKSRYPVVNGKIIRS